VVLLNVSERVGLDRPLGDPAGENEMEPAEEGFLRLAGKSAEELERLVATVVSANRERERLSHREGILLDFENVCRQYEVNQVERDILLFLLMKATALSFRRIMGAYDGEGPFGRHANGIRAGTLLGLVSNGYADEIANRRCLSTESNLVRHEIIVGRHDDFDTMASILDEQFCLSQRIVNYIIGDNWIYSPALGFISRFHPTVALDQVVFDEEAKREMVTQAQNFLRLQTTDAASRLRDYYGYGTGLAYLFHGPSGTGKTMMAHALAHDLGKPLLSVNLETARRMRGSAEEVIKYVMKEARLTDAIVFFDECDDMFRQDSYESLVLLVELEKAQCITIFTTNKVLKLDPALDRRITLKVRFSLPDTEQRKLLWQRLVPPFAEVAPDVDFGKMAERYLFSGGLIKNTVLMAIHDAAGEEDGGKLVLRAGNLERAAQVQTRHLFQTSKFEEVVQPTVGLNQLPVGPSDRRALANLVECVRGRTRQETGACIVLTSPCLATAVKAVEAVAGACSVQVRKFCLEDVLAGKVEDTCIDPVTQERIYDPLELVFRAASGQRSLTLIVDETGMAFETREPAQGKTPSSSRLLKRLGSCNQVCFLVCREFKAAAMPREVDLVVHLAYPPEEAQITRWESVLNGAACDENALIGIVERYPMHLAQIDQCAERARMLSTLKHGDETRAAAYIERTIKQYRNGAPILFGTKSPSTLEKGEMSWHRSNAPAVEE